jgi:hypothetical protein
MQDNANSELPVPKQIPWNKLMMLFPTRNRSTSDLYVRSRPRDGRNAAKLLQRQE